MGSILLRKIQIGRETTAGVPVAATKVLRLTGIPSDDREITQPDENIGLLSKADRTNTAKLAASFEMDGDLTFQEAPYLFAASLENTVSPVSDGEGSGKVYEYKAGVTGSRVISTFTLEGGDSQKAGEMEYSFIKTLTISGAGAEPVTVNAVWNGRQLSDTEFTPSLPIEDVQSANFGLAHLYIDSIDGTAGTTEITETFLGFRLTINSGWEERYASGSDSKCFTHIACLNPEINLELDFERNSNAEAVIGYKDNETPKLIRLELDGNPLTTAGTTYSKFAVIFDLAGKFTKVDEGDKDDGAIVTAQFAAGYNGTAAKFFDAIVVNEVAAL